jgi:hypothetical protein
MHFHNVYYWGKSRYHLEFSPNRTNYGRQVPLKQTLGGLSIVVRIPTRMSAVLHRKEFMFKTFVTFWLLPLCHLIRSKDRGGLLLYYVNIQWTPGWKFKRDSSAPSQTTSPPLNPIETKETDGHAQPGSLSQFELKHKRTKLTTQIKDQQSIKLHT